MDNPIANITIPPPAWLAETDAWTRFWFRHEASTFAPGVDALFFFIFWVSAFFFVLIVALLVYFGIKYRRRPGVPIQLSPSHNTTLEVAWSVIPTLIMVVMFVWGLNVFFSMRIAPGDAEELWVEASKWEWKVEYPNGATSLETVGEDHKVADKNASVFAVPLGRPVKVILTSKDVLHSFYIPAFRVKRDVFPNRYTTLWFTPTGEPTHVYDTNLQKCVPSTFGKAEGLYNLFCAEYCGDSHSQMVGRIAVLTPEDYDLWKAKQADTSTIPLLELGKALWTTRCQSCHTVDGRPSTGPTWTETWANIPRPGWVDPGKDDAFEGPDGAKMNYIQHSILHPQEYYVPGFEGVAMSSFQGQFTHREIRAIAVFIKSLDPASRGAAEQDSAGEKADQATEGAAPTAPATEGN